MVEALRYAVRRLRRGWRSGELLILTLALTIAVASVSAVGLFTERVRLALESQSGETLGADLLLTGHDPLPHDIEDRVGAFGANTLHVTTLPSVVLSGDSTSLASVKAVESGYPLRGSLRIADEPFGVARTAAGIPPPGEAWVDQRLWSELALAPAATLQVGATPLKVTALLVLEPDRGSSYLDMAPRVLINAADLPATQLIQPGSRAQYSLLIAGPREVLANVAALELPTGLRLMKPQDARAEVRTALERAGRFLDLAVLAAALLAGAAIAICARQHGARLRDEMALLKCLGASQRYIVISLLTGLLLLGSLAGLLGVAIGLGAQTLVAGLLSSLLDAPLPPPPIAPLAGSLLLGLLMLLGFAAPPVLDARRVPPIRVFQRDLPAARASLWVPGAAILAALTLLWLQAGELKLAAYVLMGATATVAALAGLAWLLVRGLAPLRRTVGTSWRFGLGNIARRRGSSVAQTVALGLALLALLLLSVSRQDLLETWRGRLKPDTPNQFLINIQPDQLEPLRRFFAERGYKDLRLWPMARGRLAALNGQPVTAASFDDAETRRWINREFNLSWTDDLADDNRLTTGDWWGKQGRGRNWLSVEKYAVERLHLKPGDTLTLQFADRQIELTVRNTREVDWDSFRPNFFFLTPPDTLNGVPATWLTSFYLPPEQRVLLRDLIRTFPNITALDLDALMNQVRSIMDRIVRALEFIFLFALAAGLTVLLAAIEGTRDERRREVALLRTLGARRTVIVKGLIAEYAVLGALSGTVAAVAAQAITWVLAARIFAIPYGPRPWLWLIGAVLGASLVAALGWFSLRRTLNTSPTLVLQQS